MDHHMEDMDLMVADMVVVVMVRKKKQKKEKKKSGLKNLQLIHNMYCRFPLPRKISLLPTQNHKDTTNSNLHTFFFFFCSIRWIWK